MKATNNKTTAYFIFLYFLIAYNLLAYKNSALTYNGRHGYVKFIKY